MNFWKKLFNLLAPFKQKIIKTSLIMILFKAVQLIAPYLWKKILDILVVFSPEKYNYLLQLVILMFVVYTIVNFIDVILSTKMMHIILSIEHFLPIEAQKKLVFLSLGYHEKENTGTKIEKVQQGVNKLVNLLENLFFEVISTIVQAILTFFMMLWFDWQIALLFSSVIPVFGIMTHRMNKRLYPMRRARQKKYEDATGKLAQSVMNIHTVKSFVQEPREIKESIDIRDYILNKEFKEWKMRFKDNFFRSMIINIGRVSIILFGIHKAINGDISFGSLVFFVGLSETVYFSLFRLTRIYDQIQNAIPAVDRFTDLINQQSDIQNPTKGIKNTMNGEVVFNQVSFSYNNDDKKKTPNALQDINFKVNSGEVVALVGPSGGGKSTVVKLLYRHYDVSSGKILIDGIDLRELDLPNYRSQLAIVPQDVEMFDVSIAENICYGRPNCNQKEIEKAAKIANADEFIRNFPDGYKTMVGERGVRLSGGQKQRIGIARAVLNNPKILIFDEATSSLDSESERLIQKSMSEIAKDRTMFVIAHRLSTIQNADKIIVIKDGKIAEIGNHQTLLRKNGLYHQLVELQSMGEI